MVGRHSLLLAALQFSLTAAFQYKDEDVQYAQWFQIAENNPTTTVGGCSPPADFPAGLEVSEDGSVSGKPTTLSASTPHPPYVIRCADNESAALNIVVVSYENAKTGPVSIEASQLAVDATVVIIDNKYAVTATTENPTAVRIAGTGLETDVKTTLQLPMYSHFEIKLDAALSDLPNQQCEIIRDIEPYIGEMRPGSPQFPVYEWHCFCLYAFVDESHYDGLTCPSAPDPLHGQLFVYVVVAIGCCILVMMCWKKQMGDRPEGWQHGPNQPLLMREEVEDLYKEGSWECEVCRFQNDPHSKTCVMCGALPGYLTGGRSGGRDRHRAVSKSERVDDMSSWSTLGSGSSSSSGSKTREAKAKARAAAAARETGSSTRRRDRDSGSMSKRGAFGGDSFAGARSSSLLLHGWDRQQSFAVRRLNRLNQRQMGARRRHQWMRKAGADGQLHWHRNLDTKTPRRKATTPEREQADAADAVPSQKDEEEQEQAQDQESEQKQMAAQKAINDKAKKKKRKKKRKKAPPKSAAGEEPHSHDGEGTIIDLDVATAQEGDVIDLDSALESGDQKQAGEGETTTAVKGSPGKKKRMGSKISSFLARKSGRRGERSNSTESGSCSNGAGATVGGDDQLGAAGGLQFCPSDSDSEYETLSEEDKKEEEEEEEEEEDDDEEDVYIDIPGRQAGEASGEISFTDTDSDTNDSSSLARRGHTGSAGLDEAGCLSRQLLSLEEPCDLYMQSSVTSVASVLAPPGTHSRGAGSGSAVAGSDRGGSGSSSPSPGRGRVSGRMNSAVLSVGFVGQFRTDDTGRPAEGMTFVEAHHAAPSRCLPQNFLVEIEAEDLEYIASLPFKDKYRWFLQQTAAMKLPWEEGHIEFEIDRADLLECSVRQLHELPVAQLNQSMRVTFQGEPAIDAGGLEREWFMLLSDAIFAETTGLFRVTHVENLSCAINPCSDQARPDDHLDCFHALGRLLGRALFEGQQITAHLSLPLLKHLLGVPISFSDLMFVDSQLHANLQGLRKTCGADLEGLCLDFTTAEERLDGTMRIVELKNGGTDIDVTDENVDEYVKLRLKYIMLSSISSQLRQLLKGLYEVIPQELITIFDYQELELMLNGVPEINLEDWREHTQVAGVKMDTVLEWFWEIVTEFDHEERARLLQFSTGSTRVPVQGFKSLQANDGRICPFTLNGIELSDCAFPRSHTCFNRIDLPKYESKDDLLEALTLVINMELTGFTLE